MVANINFQNDLRPVGPTIRDEIIMTINSHTNMVLDRTIQGLIQPKPWWCPQGMWNRVLSRVLCLHVTDWEQRFKEL